MSLKNEFEKFKIGIKKLTKKLKISAILLVIVIIAILVLSVTILIKLN